MSDDTPTQPYGRQPGDIPTERFTQSGSNTAFDEPLQPSDSPEGDSPRKSNGLLLTLVSLVVAVLIALIAIVLLLLGRGDAAEPIPSLSAPSSESVGPSPSVTPSATPSEEPSPTTEPVEPAPPPPPPAPIAAFTVSPSSADCPETNSGFVPLSFSWDATGTHLWFGVDTDDAYAAPYGEYPLQVSGMNDVSYQCDQPSHRYAITVESADGTHTHQTITIRRS